MASGARFRPLAAGGRVRGPGLVDGGLVVFPGAVVVLFDAEAVLIESAEMTMGRGIAPGGGLFPEVAGAGAVLVDADALFIKLAEIEEGMAIASGVGSLPRASTRWNSVSAFSCWSARARRKFSNIGIP